MKSARWLCLCLLAGLSIPGSLNAEDTEYFKYSRLFEIKETDQGELYSVPLDSDVYAATRNGFPDVRILDGEQRLVPFQIRPIAGTRARLVRKTWTAANPAPKPLDNNGMEIRITLGKDDPAPGGLRFITPLTNFEQQVQVFAIKDGAEHPLVDDALIFDYSQFMDVRRTEVALPESDTREFRIMVNMLTPQQESELLELSRSLKGGTEEGRTEKTTILRRPFRIDRIEFWTEHSEEIPDANIVQPWAVSELQVTQDAKHKETHVEFKSRREPLMSLKIVSSGRNFSRRAEVQIQAGLKWETIAEATISKFQLGDIREEHVTIDVPETRHDRFRLVISNGDSPEIPVDAIEAVGTQYQLLFLRQPGQSVHMVYGSKSAGVPQQDTAALSYALAQKVNPTLTTLGVQSENSPAITRSIDMKSLLNNPVVLGAGVLVLVLALGWGLYNASRRIDQMPRVDGD